SAAHELLAGAPLPLQMQDPPWSRQVIEDVARAVAGSMDRTQPVTHVAHGEAKVSEVASNRRVMGSAGRVAFVRTSATADPKIREMPEGLIDPMLKTLS